MRCKLFKLSKFTPDPTVDFFNEVKVFEENINFFKKYLYR